MNKREFLDQLRGRLSGLPKREADERLGFYSEMIDDRIEEGLSEEEAVSAIGSVESIAAQILSDTPAARPAKEAAHSPNNPPKKLRVWEIVLLAVGSPLWISLLIAAFAVLLALCVSLWAVIVSLWAAFASLAAGTLAGIVGGAGFAIFGRGLTGLAIVGAGFVCGGLTVFAFFGCKAATRGAVWLTKKTVSGIVKCFKRKEARYE